MRCKMHKGIPVVYEIAPPSMARSSGVDLGGRSMTFAHVEVPGYVLAQVAPMRAPKGLGDLVRKYVEHGHNEARRAKLQDQPVVQMRDELMAAVRAAAQGNSHFGRTSIDGTLPPSRSEQSEPMGLFVFTQTRRPYLPEESDWHGLRNHPALAKTDLTARMLIAREVVPCAQEMLALLEASNAQALARAAQSEPSLEETRSPLRVPLPDWTGQPQEALMTLTSILLHGVWGGNRLCETLPRDHDGVRGVLYLTHEYIVSLMVIAGLVVGPMDEGVHRLIERCVLGTSDQQGWQRIGAEPYGTLFKIAHIVTYPNADEPARSPRGVGVWPQSVITALEMRDHLVKQRADDGGVYAQSVAYRYDFYSDYMGIHPEPSYVIRSIASTQAISVLAEALYPMAWAIAQAMARQPVQDLVGEPNTGPVWSSEIYQLTSHLCALLCKRVAANDIEHLAQTVMSVVDEACVLWLTVSAPDVHGHDPTYTDVDHALFVSQAVVSYWALLLALSHGTRHHVVRACAGAMDLARAGWLEAPACGLSARPSFGVHHTSQILGPGNAHGVGLSILLVYGYGGHLTTDTAYGYVEHLVKRGNEVPDKGIGHVYNDSNVVVDPFPQTMDQMATIRALEFADALKNVLYPKETPRFDM